MSRLSRAVTKHLRMFARDFVRACESCVTPFPASTTADLPPWGRTADLLATRIEARRLRAAEHAGRLRARLPELTERACAVGATEVVLFGSIMSGATPHEDSDVDLAVGGLSQVSVEMASLELGTWLGARVQLVRREDASAELADLVGCFGRSLMSAP